MGAINNNWHTIGHYGPRIEAKLRKKQMSFTAAEKNLSITKGAISGLVRGTRFPSKNMIDKILTYCGFTESERDTLHELIKRQRKSPNILDPAQNHYVTALRRLHSLSGGVTQPEHIETFRQIENCRTSLGDKRISVLGKVLGQDITLTDTKREELNKLLKTYDPEIILTAANMIAAKLK